MSDDTYAEAEAAYQKLEELFGEYISACHKPDGRAEYARIVKCYKEQQDRFWEKYGSVYPLRPDNIDTAKKLLSWLTQERDAANYRRRELHRNGHGDMMPDVSGDLHNLGEAVKVFDRLGLKGRPPIPPLDPMSLGQLVAEYDKLILAARAASPQLIGSSWPNASKVAKAAGVASAATITRAAEAGEFQSYEVGGEVKIDPVGAIDWMAKRAGKPAKKNGAVESKSPAKAWKCKCNQLYRIDRDRCPTCDRPRDGNAVTELIL